MTMQQMFCSQNLHIPSLEILTVSHPTISAHSLRNAQCLFLKILFFYFREGKGVRKRGRETSMCGCLSCAPCWGPGLQPRHVP